MKVQISRGDKQGLDKSKGCSDFSQKSVVLLALFFKVGTFEAADVRRKKLVMLISV